MIKLVKLVGHFGARNKFWKPNYRSQLAFTDELTTDQAIEFAFGATAPQESNSKNVCHYV